VRQQRQGSDGVGSYDKLPRVQPNGALEQGDGVRATHWIDWIERKALDLLRKPMVSDLRSAREEAYPRGLRD